MKIFFVTQAVENESQKEHKREIHEGTGGNPTRRVAFCLKKILTTLNFPPDKFTSTSTRYRKFGAKMGTPKFHIGLKRWTRSTLFPPSLFIRSGELFKTLGKFCALLCPSFSPSIPHLSFFQIQIMVLQSISFPLQRHLLCLKPVVDKSVTSRSFCKLTRTIIVLCGYQFGVSQVIEQEEVWSRHVI